MKYITLILLTSCGIHISSDPIIVTHKLDLSLVGPYCQTRCKDDLDVKVCTDKCINDFLLTLGNVSVK